MKTTLPLTARLSMSMASASELLVEPPRYIWLTPNGGDMGKRQSNLVLVETMVQPFDLGARLGLVGKDKLGLPSLQGEGYRRIESAYAHTSTIATSTREGLLAARKGSAGMKPTC